MTYLVNSPRVLTALFAAARPFMPASDAAKFVACADTSCLAGRIDPAQLPPFLGGACALGCAPGACVSGPGGLAASQRAMIAHCEAAVRARVDPRWLLRVDYSLCMIIMF